MVKKTLSAGQQDYEAKRAAKAGMSLDKWLALKSRQAEADERARLRAVAPPKPAKPPGLFKRLIDRAHTPLKAKGDVPAGTPGSTLPKSQSGKGRSGRQPPSSRSR